MQSKPDNRRWLIVGLVCLVIAFTIDVLFPLGVNAGYLYVIIAISAFFVSARDAIVLASAATAANVLAYCFAPTVRFAEWTVAFSRGASVLATWLLIITGIHFHKNAQAVIATIRESNERRRLALEEAERVQRERLTEVQFLTDAIPMLIAYLDSSQRFQFVNASYESSYEVSLENIIGRTFEELVGHEVYERLERHIGVVLQGKRVQFEEQLFRPDGVHWWLFQLLPRVDEHQRVAGFYSLVTDITGLKRSQVEVDLQREALALFSRRGAANEMAAALAHEMNQPLSTIAIYSGRLAQLLSEGKADADDLLQAIELIHEEALRAGQIVKRARLMVDDKPIQPMQINAAELLDSVQKICSTRAASARVSVNLKILSHQAPIYADWVQLQQVLVNLVSNAIDASTGLPRDRRRITITASTSDEGAELCVIDAGDGMNAEQLQRLFEPHFTTKSDGLGIGLNIARGIVQTHGGTLTATPNSRLGMTFRVDLPLPPSSRAFPNDSEILPLLTKSG